MITILALSMATACLSFTISESALMRPFRVWAATRGPGLEKLVCCGYCLGHWIALPLVLVYDPGLVASGIAFLDLLVTVLCVAWLAGAQWAVMCGFMAWIGK
jgi:hypothetical protein